MALLLASVLALACTPNIFWSGTGSHGFAVAALESTQEQRPGSQFLSTVNSKGLKGADHILPPSGATRRLKQLLLEPVELTVVTTEEEFSDAMLAGDGRIEIRQHLDFTTASVEPPNNSASTFSITGNCSEPSTEEVTASMQPGHCLIHVSSQFLIVTAPLWVDKLHVLRKGLADKAPLVATGSNRARLWMTNVTLEGSGQDDCSTCGMLLHSGHAYTEDSRITNFRTSAPVTLGPGSTASFKHCVFSHNTLAGNDSSSAIIYAVSAPYPTPMVRLEGCEFSNNSDDFQTLLSDKRFSVRTVTSARAFSGDASLPQVCTYELGMLDEPDCTYRPVSPLERIDSRFLSASDPWLRAAQQGQRMDYIYPVDISYWGSDRVYLLWGFVAAAISACFILVALMMCLCSRKKVTNLSPLKQHRAPERSSPEKKLRRSDMGQAHTDASADAQMKNFIAIEAC